MKKTVEIGLNKLIVKYLALLKLRSDPYFFLNFRMKDWHVYFGSP